MDAPAVATPLSAEEAAEIVRDAARPGRRLRFRGAGTKLGWGAPVPEPDVEIATWRLDRIVEHNAADLTAVLEAGVPLARAQEAFAGAGQMLAVDPSLGREQAATIGGVVATADSGPLRHRYGGPRDLVLGMTVVLSDGTVASSGGKVIKNVAGYDLAKLFAGSFGRLGMIVRIAVRLHPQPRNTASAVGRSSDPAAVQAAAGMVSETALELEALDVMWSNGEGTLLARAAGAAPEPRLRRAAALMQEAGLEPAGEDGWLHGDDESLWEAQRAGQRAEDATVVRVAGMPGTLGAVLAAADTHAATVVGRAGIGTCWISIPSSLAPEDAIGAVEELRARLAPTPCLVLDGPDAVRRKVDIWALHEGPELALMRRVTSAFDPAGVCNPGLLAGGM